jgi:hypothetical protein
MSILRRELLIGSAVLTFFGTLGVAYYQDNPERTLEIPMSATGRLAQDIMKGTLSSEKRQDLTTRISTLDTQSETAIAVDSTGMHVVIGFNDFRGFPQNPTLVPTSISGFAYSDDGGLTWVDGGQLPTPGSDVIFGQRFPQVLGDPDVKYLGGCTFVYSSLMLKKFNARLVETLSLHRSTDCGHTWAGPYEIPTATNPNGLIDINGDPEDAADKDLMDVDPDTGRLMVGWSNFTPAAPGGVEISVAYSDDALTGNPPTWSARRVVAKAASDGLGAVPRFAGNGSNKVYLAWARFTGSYFNRIGFAVSEDNGASWSAPANLTSNFFTMDEVLGNDRSNTFPSLAVDNSPGPNRGHVYLVYSNNNSRDGADVVLLRSNDEGATFLPPVLLNSRPGADRAQWFPYVTVDQATGRVFVTYYDQGIASSGDLSEASFLYSNDGGERWSKPVPLSSRPFHAGYGNDTGQPNLGDYNQAVALGNELLAAFAATPPLVNFSDGQPRLVMTAPDVYVNESLVFKKVSASKSEAAVRLGRAAFTDSGGDGYLNAGDGVDLTIPLENYVTNPLSAETLVGVNAKLSTSTPGVTVIQENGTYPNLEPGGSASNRNPYRLQLAPSFIPGARLELKLDVHTSRGESILLFTLPTGTPMATTIFAEDFNGVVPGVLPAGWTRSHGGGANVVPWTTTQAFCGATSNAAFHQNANDGPAGGSPSRWERLFSPIVTVPSAAEYVTLDFDVCYDTEEDPVLRVLAYDGFFLRITDQTAGRVLRSVLAEAFAEEFTTGSLQHYPRHLPRNDDPSYFEDMSAWAGRSGGFQHVHMKLPGMNGSRFQLRFEYTQDFSFTCANLRPGSTCGVMVDNIVIKSVTSK